MSKNKEEVLRIARKLEKMINKKTYNNALDILNILAKIPVSKETLEQTRIGMVVNNIRRLADNTEVSAKAKSLIKGWKKSVKEQQSQSGKSSGDSSSKSKISTPKPKADKPHEQPHQSQPEHKPQQIEVVIEKTNDPVRNKCRELLVNSLKMSDEVTPKYCARLAAQIEECIFQEFRNTSMKYKNRVRSRYSNLKDLKNSNLRKMVIRGIITPEKIAKMTAQEMASDELKKEREKMNAEAVKDHQMSVNEGTTTDMFTCGKCKGKRCTYNQLQTRSSDEPMTTFVFCNDCGNRWKFC